MHGLLVVSKHTCLCRWIFHVVKHVHKLQRSRSSFCNRGMYLWSLTEITDLRLRKTGALVDTALPLKPLDPERKSSTPKKSSCCRMLLTWPVNFVTRLSQCSGRRQPPRKVPPPPPPLRWNRGNVPQPPQPGRRQIGLLAMLPLQRELLRLQPSTDRSIIMQWQGSLVSMTRAS